MKHAVTRPYADPEKAARGPMLFQHGASPAEYKAGLDLAIAHG